jgi:cell division GTPase FtsZ
VPLLLLLLQVIGVGGGGGNAINRIIESEVQVRLGAISPTLATSCFPPAAVE